MPKTKSKASGSKTAPTGTVGPQVSGSTTWDVTSEARGQVSQHEKAMEPWVQTPINLEGQTTFPAIYGADLQERKRQMLISKLKTATGRDVMLDDRTIDYWLGEEARLFLVDRDMKFAEECRAKKYFETPMGLEYAHKINPGYFQRQVQLMKTVAPMQLKLAMVRMNGIQTEEDWKFVNWYNSLTPQQRGFLDRPVHLLNQTPYTENAKYQKGLLGKLFQPNPNYEIPFGGLGTPFSSTVGMGARIPQDLTNEQLDVTQRSDDSLLSNIQ